MAAPVKLCHGPPVHKGAGGLGKGADRQQHVGMRLERRAQIGLQRHDEARAPAAPRRPAGCSAQSAPARRPTAAVPPAAGPASRRGSGPPGPPAPRRPRCGSTPARARRRHCRPRPESRARRPCSRGQLAAAARRSPKRGCRSAICPSRTMAPARAPRSRRRSAGRQTSAIRTVGQAARRTASQPGRSAGDSMLAATGNR